MVYIAITGWIAAVIGWVIAWNRGAKYWKQMYFFSMDERTRLSRELYDLRYAAEPVRDAKGRFVGKGK
jgi:hypothetical protein